MHFILRRKFLCFFVLLGAIGCVKENSTRPEVLRLATTTSTRDSGLLEELLPPFEAETGIRVDVIAVGTGKALQLGAKGDADVLLVHAREAEEDFMAAGHGVRREDVMHNWFEILGPPDDPAQIEGMAPDKALEQVAASGQPFISRSDDSGTHRREQQLWRTAGGLNRWPQYVETGQGMGATLIIADQLQGYVLCDRGTYLNFRQKIELRPLVTGFDSLRNPYGAITVNPDIHPAVRADLGQRLLDYLQSVTVQQRIGDFRLAGEILFHPARESE